MKSNAGVDDTILTSYRVVANLQGIRILIIVFFLLFLIGGLGLDWVNIEFEVWGKKIGYLKMFWHAIGAGFGLLSLILLKIFFTPKNIEEYSNLFVRNFQIYIYFVCTGILLLCTMLTLIEQFYTTNLLFFAMAMAGIVAFLHVRQKMLVLIFLPPLILFFYLLPNYQANPSVVTSNIILIIGVSIAALIGNGVIEKKFIENVKQRELIKKQTGSLLDGNLAKDTILSVVAHDLRTPVANIDQLVELILHQSTNEEEKENYVSLIKQSCDQAFEIIEDILELSTGSKTKLHLTPTDLRKIIDDVILVHAKKSSQKKITLNFIADDLPVIAAVQPSKIERVLHNLVSNAIKFTPAGGSVEISCFDKDGTANIVIKDNGIGIPEELLGDLFVPFSKARRTGINGEKTIGLGLSIVKSIVENHHGTIQVTSHELRGTTFDINIPCFY